METSSIQRTNNVFIPIIRKPESVYVPHYLEPQVVTMPQKEVRNLPFIEANTKEVTLSHVKDDCIIPVFSKDNEVTISHQSFIDSVLSAAKTVFPYEDMSDPVIRVSHVVKGRIPEAIHKPVSQLLESDKTIYYERMMFCFEVPSIHQDIDGCRLNLTIGGVRAYNEQNLYSRKAPEKFRIFIGFKNMVCCNLCVSTDGYKASLRVMDPDALLSSASDLFRSYDMERHLALMTAQHASEVHTVGDEIDAVSGKPDALILCYPVVTFQDPYAHTGSRKNFLGPDRQFDVNLQRRYSGEEQVGSGHPPVFVWHCEDDASVPVQNSIMLSEALSRAGISHKLTVYPGGAHGLGLAPGYEEISHWPEDAIRWLSNE